MAIKTWIGRYSIVDGRVQEEGPWMGAFVRQRPDEVTDELYVIVEPALPGSEQFCGQLVEVVGRLFRQDTLSLTGAVIRSLRAAHEHLREWNQRSLREHRVASGAACLAVQGTQAYVSLVGPSLAYVFQNGTLTRLVPAERDPEDALGLADELYPDLHRVPLTPGARVVICSTRLDRLVDEATLSGILAQDEPLPDLYRLTKDEPDFSLVMLACYEEPDPEPVAVPEETAAPSPPRPISGAREPRPRPAGERASRLPPLPHEGAQIPLAPPPAPTHREVEAFASEHPPGVDVTRPVVRLRGEGSAGMFRRRTGPSGGLRVPLPLVALALVVGLAAIVAYCALPGSVEESRQQRLEAVLIHARGALYLASQETDPGEKRRWLEEASRAIADAAAIDPADDLVITTQGQIRAAVEALDAVTDLGTLPPLVDLRATVAGDLSSARLEAGGQAAFFLDTASGRVIEASLAPGGAAPRVALREGDEVAGARAARVERIAWAPDAGVLLALDAGRRLYAIPPGGQPRPLALRDAAEWRSAGAIATYDGNLYVLDPAGGAVWRYVPTEGGFDSERQSVVAAADLADASDLAAAGDVYLLDGGRVRRFNTGQELAFPLSGIDRPLSSPAGLAVDLARSEVYIADRGNRRIVVASLDGVFLRQLTSPSFTDLRDVAVDPQGRLFVLNGDALLELPAAR
jgi:sugar lactone lactonase YvrE